MTLQLYKAIKRDTGEVIGAGTFGRAYDLAYGSYEETREMTPDERRARAEPYEIVKLFDFSDDYSASDNMANWFTQAVEMMEAGDGLDDRDESDRIDEALDSAVSVYTADIIEAALQDISLATEPAEYIPDTGATVIDVLRPIIYQKLSDAVHAYREALREAKL